MLTEIMLIKTQIKYKNCGLRGQKLVKSAANLNQKNLRKQPFILRAGIVAKSAPSSSGQNSEFNYQYCN